MNSTEEKHNFWWHLDVLRTVLIRIIIVSVVCGVVAFLFKEEVFFFVLAPKADDFVTYRLLDAICGRFGFSPVGTFDVRLINTGLAQQFMIHIKTAFCVGVICASPYILYQLFSFIAPALYDNEKRNAVRIVFGGYLMFALGLVFNYYVIFPLTFHFLGTYQVAGEVANMISLDSYMSTLIVMSLCMGIVFEIPVLAWLFAKIGLIDASMLKHYRRHAIVAILIVAAVITPTSDVFTLLIVSLPMYLLYEVSILLVRMTGPRRVYTASLPSVSV
ncbi:MAG: twin-arginine translocase subunit TatC [Muribaculaceae bacterium]|nr:twin-arginine translocase subunit TatC [Muribaculaceae bacterium]